MLPHPSLACPAPLVGCSGLLGAATPEKELEFELVTNGNTVVTEVRNLRFEMARLRDRACVSSPERPAATAVEVDRWLVVVRGDEPEASASSVARKVFHGIEECGRSSRAPHKRDEHDHFALGLSNVVQEQPAGGGVSDSDQTGKRLAIVQDAARDNARRGEVLGDDFAYPRSVSESNGVNLHAVPLQAPNGKR